MKKNYLLTIFLLFTFLVKAQSPFIGDPKEVGFSSEALTNIDQTLQGYIDKGEVPGTVALIAKNGKIRYIKAFGMKDIEEKEKMETTSIFRIASMTKAITTVGVMMLFEEGKFKLDDPISKYIPAFSNMSVIDEGLAKRDITIRHLLTHTSGLSYAFTTPQKTYDLYTQNDIYNGVGKTKGTVGDNVKRLAALPLVTQPGEKFRYGLNTDVLGYMIEIISGMTLDEFLQDRIFTPLGMADTYFFLPKEKEKRLVALYGHNEEKKLNRIEGEAKAGAIHYADYTTYASNPKYFSGGGGLSSTVQDYYIFLQMLLNNGSYGGKQFLKPETVDLMTSNQTGDLFNWWKGNGFGFGFTISRGKEESGGLESKGTYGWLGALSTYYWVDPKQQLIGLLYTQLQPNKSDIDRVFRTLTYQALEE